MRILFIILFFSTFIKFNFAASIYEAPKIEKGYDTTEAIVLYGKSFLFDPVKYQTKYDLVKLVDSLLDLNEFEPKRLEQLKLFMTIGSKTKKEVNKLLDSLFDLPEIPYALINQINYYSATNFIYLNGKDVELSFFYDNDVIPCGSVYKTWENDITYRDKNKFKVSGPITLTLVDSLNFCEYVHPVNGDVTSNFGWRKGRPHNGIDLQSRTGDPIRSAFDGMVRIAKKDGGYGNVVVVRHYNGLETLYAHLSKMKVKPGDIVSAGQLIGLAGNTGRSHGPHLHFEVRFLGQPIDPNHIISFRNRSLHDAEFIVNQGINQLSVYPKGAKYHTVRRGELLYQIANRYNLTVEQICELNNLSKRRVIYVGQKLRIS